MKGKPSTDSENEHISIGVSGFKPIGMTVHKTFSFTDSFFKRFSDAVPIGQRSILIQRLVSQELDRMDGKIAETKRHEEYLQTIVFPKVEKHISGFERSKILQLYYNRGSLETLSRELGIDSWEDVKSAVGVVLDRG